jgi:hypothetical protein
MFCNYCRAVNPQDAVYCSVCGQTIRAFIESGKKEHEKESIEALPAANKSPSPLAKTSEDTVAQPVRRIPSSLELEKLPDTELGELLSAHAKNKVFPSQSLHEELRSRALRMERDPTTLADQKSSVPVGTIPSGGNEFSVDDAQREKYRSFSFDAAPLATDVFRDSKDVHVRRGAQFPSVCLKCGYPAGTFIKKKVYWHPSWLLALILLGLWPYIIATLLVRKGMELKMPLCKVHRKKYRLFQILSPAIIAGGFCLLISGAYLPQDYSGVAIGAGILVVIFGLIFWHVTSTLLKATAIDGERGIFRGAAQEFLASIPSRPCNPERSPAEIASSLVSPHEAEASSPTNKTAHSSAPAAAGTMGKRFAAYFADVVVVYLIVISVYFAGEIFGWHLSGGDAEANVIYFGALFVYMIVAQTAYHTTIGKYIKELEVCSDKLDARYPSVGRIVLRETLGRLLSCLFFGAGYWTADKSKRNQAWSDQLAGTVVTKRSTTRVLVRALTAFVVVSFLLDVGVLGFGLYKQDWDKRYASFTTEIEAATKDVVATRDAVDQRMTATKPVNDWADFLQWQDRMRSLKTDLNLYENQIDRMRGLLQRGVNEGLFSSQVERNQYVKLREVYDVRRRQAEKLREEADLVINCDGRRPSMTSLYNDLRLLDSDIKLSHFSWTKRTGWSQC